MGYVNCDQERELCRTHSMASLPAFLLISGGRPSEALRHQQDAISTKELYAFTRDNIPSDVLNIRLLTQAQEFVSLECTARGRASLGVGIILFTDKFETPFIMKAAAFHLRKKVAVGG